MGIKKYLPYAAGAALAGGLLLKGGLGGLLGGGCGKKDGGCGTGKSCGTCKGSGKEAGGDNPGGKCRTCGGDGILNMETTTSGEPTERAISQLKNQLTLRGLDGAGRPDAEMPAQLGADPMNEEELGDNFGI